MKKYSKVTLPAGIIIVKRLTPSTRLATINDDDNRNGENCLKAIYGTSTKLEFAYDYNGRRFNKKVYAKSGGNWVLSRESLFVYDNFKQIAEFTVSGSAKTLAKSYAWQPEASGDFDVPLWQKVGGNVYTCVVDGNKNVRRLLNTAGTEVANYDYDPFGGVTASGTASAGNPFRFSSEFLDEETGLVYYNYRYYSPALGRWISRDPSGEQNSKLLYCFLNNRVMLEYDQLGYWGESIHKQKTIEWAIELEYERQAALAIGKADNDVDSLLNPDTNFLPGIGQKYHFISQGTDYRQELYRSHFNQAVEFCKKNSPKEAAKELGIGLHPLQDIVAHGAYGSLNQGHIYIHHNAYSPQQDFGSPGFYPDDETLDAVGSGGNGIPDSKALKYISDVDYAAEVHFGKADYAIYIHGNQRYQKVHYDTVWALASFKQILKANQSYSDCRCYFLGIS